MSDFIGGVAREATSGHFSEEASVIFDQEEMDYYALRDAYDELSRLRGSHAISNDADAPVSIPSDTFYEAIFAEFFRFRSYRVGAVFIGFVIVLCLILFMNRVDVFATTASYFSQQGALALLELDKFRAMESISDFYAWGESIVENLDKAREPIKHSLSAATPYPMGLILLRQVRGVTTVCSIENTFFSGLRPRVCVPAKTVYSEPFGSKLQPEMYKPNGQLPSSAIVDAQEMSGVYIGMQDNTYIYERHLYFGPLGQWEPQTAAPVVTTATAGLEPTTSEAAATTSTTAAAATNTTTTTTTSTTTTTQNTSTSTTTTSSTTSTTTTSMPQTTNASDIPAATEPPSVVGKAAMLQELRDLQANEFFNESTWSLAVDVAFVHPALRVFTVVTLLMERLPSNAMRPTIESNTFLITKISFVDPTSVFTFVADLFVAGFVIYCVGELVSDVWARLELSVSQLDAISQSVVPFCLTVLQIITLTAVVAYRFQIWSLVATATDEIDKSTDTEKSARVTLHALSQISSLLQASYRNFSISLLLCLFRLLVFAEALDGVNMLSRAIRLNGSELATVIMLVLAVIIMFGVAGNVFFDDELKEYSTVRSTVSSLTRSLSSSGTDAWRDLGETSPRQAAFFFLAFWLTLWLVLLNMVLAVVVAAVEAVQRTATEGAKFDTMWYVLKRHVLMLGSFYSGSRISPEVQRWGGAAGAAAAGGTTMPLPYRLRYAKWRQDYATRYSAVVNVKKWVQDGEKEVFYNDLNVVLNSVPLSVRKQLYASAADMYQTELALRATRSRTADETEVASRLIDKQLLVLERKLDLAPQADKRSKEEALAEEEQDEDPELAFERLLRKAIRTRAGVAEMLILSRATGAILEKENQSV